MIALDHVTVERGANALLRDATLAVEPGAFTAILGANGAGKTSLVRVMSGEWTPTRGAVTWAGRPMAEEDRALIARRRAVVSQHTPVTFPFRAMELVLLGRLPHARYPADSDIAVATAAMEQAGIASHARRRVDTLSGGERQRVYVARAIAQLHEARRVGAGLLLLDEPTAHLDLAHQERTLGIARTLAGEGLTVVAVLHDVNLAAAYADRIVLMKHGRLLAVGTPSDVLTPALLREALGVSLDEIRRPGAPSVFVPHSVLPRAGKDGA